MRGTNDVGFIPISVFNVENLPFIVSRTLACVRMPVYAYAFMKLAYAGLEHVYAYACLGMHALEFPWPLFSKNSFV